MASVHRLWASSARTAKAGVEVALVGSDGGVVLGHIGIVVLHGKFQRLEPLVQRFEAQRLGNALDGFGQQGRSFLEAAGGDQQAHIVKAHRRWPDRPPAHRPASAAPPGCRRIQQGLGFVGVSLGRQLALGGQMLVQELAQLASGWAPMKPSTGLPPIISTQVGMERNAEHAGQLLLLSSRS
jgi:hypothetical protein